MVTNRTLLIVSLMVAGFAIVVAIDDILRRRRRTHEPEVVGEDADGDEG